MNHKVICTDGLRYYDKLIKQYIDKKIELGINGVTNCPNCGAAITSDICEYCGTNFGIFFDKL